MTGRTSCIATVCLSGTLGDKLEAASAAGFDGVEIFEADLVASPWTPDEIGRRCADLGLSVELYQPFRDLDSADPDRFEANLRRLEHKLDVASALSAELILVCSSVAPDAVTDDDRLAEQLARAAGRAAARGRRLAFEALAWGAHVSTYPHSWDVVRRADHPALGLCLDSFHHLARGGDPAGVSEVPGEKLFMLQLADAPRLAMDVLEWSRHHRQFPGQGDWDLAGLLRHVVATGYAGPLSLEVFNDVFRQAEPRRTAVDARRCLLLLEDELTGPPVLPGAPAPTGFACAELAADEDSLPRIGAALAALGFAGAEDGRGDPARLWTQGSARVLLGAAGGEPGAGLRAFGVHSPDPSAAAARAAALLAPPADRSQEQAGVVAPDGTRVFFRQPDPGPPDNGGNGIEGIDHLGLTQPYDWFDEATVFYRSVLNLCPGAPTTEVVAPFGLVRGRSVGTPSGAVRLNLSVSRLRRGDWSPHVANPQYIAFGCTDLLASVEVARRRGAPMLTIPDNYYDDLDARFAPAARLLTRLRELGVLYDRDRGGEYLHAYTELLGGALFFGLVQRIGHYTGYGATDLPVRMAAHRTARIGEMAPV